jgi:hypothetical protein
VRGARVGRALLVALATGSSLFVSSSGADAAASCPSSQPCIAVHLPDGTVQYVDADAINSEAAAAQNADAPNAVKPGQAYPGSPNVVNLGLSVNAMLADLDPPLQSAVTFTAMPRPADGTTAVLTADNLAAPSNYEQGLLPAFYVDGNQIQYVRAPLNDSDDPSTDDGVQSQQDGTLDLFAYTGPMLHVSDSASDANPSAGQSVTFTASSDATAAESVTYTWTSSDRPTPVSEPVLSRTFPVAGTYEMFLRASGTDGSGGAADPLWVTVGPSTHTTTPPVTKTPGGGHSSPPGTPKPGPSNGHGNQPTSSPAPHPSPSVSAPGITGTALPGPSLATIATNARKPLVASAERSSPPATVVLDNDNLPLVRGQLIGPGAVVLSGSVPGAAQAGVSPAGRLSRGWRAAGLVGSVAAIMLLFAAGAARELRWFRRLRSVVRPR